MTAEAAFTRSWKVGPWTAHLSIRRSAAPGTLTSALIEWTPDTPPRLTPREFEEYRRGRDSAMAELAQAIGGSVLVVEA